MSHATAHTRSDITISDRPLGRNVPQKVGTLLWAPMLLMALIAFPLALALAILRASLVAQSAAPAAAAALGQLVPAAMFLGFASVFAALSFAIARILGVLRTGGGAVQAAAARKVHTLKMPLTGMLFIVLIAMAMMLLLFAVIAHVALAAQPLTGTGSGDPVLGATARTWAEWLEGVRRFGASTYLLSIALGLATIFKVLGFQAQRIRSSLVSGSSPTDQTSLPPGSDGMVSNRPVAARRRTSKPWWASAAVNVRRITRGGPFGSSARPLGPFHSAAAGPRSDPSTDQGGHMRQGTYRLTSGALLRCRIDQAGATRFEVELLDGQRREVAAPTPNYARLLSDDPTWLCEETPVALGADE